MPRKPRIQSGSGIYHVMLRGSDRQQIFFDEEDNELFLERLRRCKRDCGVAVYAYCLMGNHVHLLLRTKEVPLELILKKIGVSYAYHFNQKYQRCGHLFQDRYRSEAVEDERYFMTVLRYILQNPVKAGICAVPEAYEYSSMRAYLGKDDGLTDTGFASESCGQPELMQFLLESNEDKCLEVSGRQRKSMTDREAKKRIDEVLGSDPDCGKANRALLSEQVGGLRREGISVRQLSRLSGIPKGIIERCAK